MVNRIKTIFKATKADEQSIKINEDNYKTGIGVYLLHKHEYVIEEANWLTLPDDIEGIDHFDAVVCLGNSFAHLPDISGDQYEHRLAIRNFASMVKPGGLLLIDHRNYDYIVDKGLAPSHNIYYNSDHIKDIKTSVLYVNGDASLVTLDYNMVVNPAKDARDDTDSDVDKKGRLQNTENSNNFRLSYYPHRVLRFGDMLKEEFKEGNYNVYGDFKPIGEIKAPGFYIHVIEKSLKLTSAS